MGRASDSQPFLGHKLSVYYYKFLKKTPVKSRLDLSDFLDLVLALKKLIFARTNFYEKAFKLF